MPLQATSGAASYDGFGGGVAVVPNYIEDVFSTWLYVGNSSTQTITNGIDLSTKGGLVWIKDRTSGAQSHGLFDTARGTTKVLYSNLTNAQGTESGVTAFNTNGFAIGNDSGYNASGNNIVSWTFRKQPKFFDVVTYTGTGSARTIAHSLGSVPGCMIIKRTDAARDWAVYHRSLGATKGIYLNSTAAEFTSLTALWNGTTPTSTEFSVGTNGDVNASGGTYVAYIFAHNAGGFGLTGTDNVISCGDYVGNGSATGPTITLGYEPQWVLIKRYSGGTGSWEMFDSMRGLTMDADAILRPDLSDAEVNGVDRINPSATGFSLRTDAPALNANGSGYIYIAIRRGPMKTPTTGTSVFSPITNSNSTSTKNTTNFAVDMQIATKRSGDAKFTVDRLRGVSTNSTAQPYWLITDDSAAENSGADLRSLFWDNTGFQTPAYFSGVSSVYWNFGRAPGFFDIVCYSGTGSARTVNHNLGVAPELMIVKRRNSPAADWWVYNANLGNTKSLRFTTESVFTLLNIWNNTSPTSSVFTVGADSAVNGGGGLYVWYGFATLAGVSKVGSYTGTGNTLQIDCGFTGGARFVLIKRTDSTGAWYVWDSARGIVAGDDPFLTLNSQAAEVTNTDYVDTYSAGFEITSTAPAAINANGGTFIFLAIA